MPRKPADVSPPSALGWNAKVPLRDGLDRAYADFLANAARER
jgi:nucleoside-diphosphate-sugar epimerase